MNSDRQVPVRVVVVDDNEQDRLGRRLVLDGDAGIAVVEVMDHASALDPDRTWDGVDVVLLDLWWRGSAAYDEYAGIGVARRIRALHPRTLRAAVWAGRRDDHVTLIAISRVISDGTVGKRLREAGIDLAFDHDDHQVASPAEFAQTIRCPEAHLRSSAAADTWRAGAVDRELGLHDRTDLNGLIEEVENMEPAALIHEQRGPATSRERRQWDKTRDRLVRQFSLITPPSRQTGGTRASKIRVAELRQLVDLARRPRSGRDHESGT